ncbi:MAG: hypothetical protein P1U36_02855 [Legionellaceae bacterium]|nr:hypothetical protein [Legionellaceae bacterium]
MQTNMEKISSRFPTEKYKRFWYPTRPLFTLFTGLFIASLGWIGILPLSWALWGAAAFAFDDLPLTPINSMFTAVNNLVQGRKTLKAIVMITAISCAAISGALLGYFVFAQTPLALKLITDYIALTSCSPLLISFGAILGGYIAHATHKVSPFIGFTSGIFIASWIPFSPPLIVEVVFLSIASCSFLASVLAKQGLRMYFKYTYGDSNADGYACARPPEAQAEFINTQAAQFNVTTEAFKNLAQHCKEKISTHKSQATLFEEFTGNRTYVTNSFKDIYHGLMNPNLTETKVQEVKELIKNSKLPPDYNNPQTKLEVERNFALGMFPDLEARTRGHQVKIVEGGGLDDDLIMPFSNN